MLRISIAASSDEPSEEIIRASRIFIDSLRNCLGDFIIYLGGYWGLMRHVAEYSCSLGIPCVFILPENPRKDPPRSRCFYPVYTGLSMRQRSETLVLSGDVLAALGGGVGTEIEILMAYANSIPVYVLTGYGMDSDVFEKALSPYADSRRLAMIKVFKKDPLSMAREICLDISEKIPSRKAMREHG